MELDPTLLLTAETLYLDPGVIRGEPVDGVFTLKRVASQTYLSVNEAQARILDGFKKPCTVPQALENCIRERSCIALREFYELILQAHEAGILRSEELGAEGPAVAAFLPKRWFVGLGPRGVVALAIVGALATASIFTVNPAVALRKPADLFYGWMAVCGCLSLGHALAASALRGAGCEVHRPRFAWLTLVPHFAIDPSDACMGGRFGRAAVAGILVLPLALAAAVGLWLNAGWGMLPLAALFFECRPVGDAPIAHLLQLVRRAPLLSTDSPRLFASRIGLLERLEIARKCFDWRQAACQLGVAVAWTLALGRVGARLSGRSFGSLFSGTQLAYWERVGAGLLFTLMAAIGLKVVSLIIEYHVVEAMPRYWKQLKEEVQRWFGKPVEWKTLSLIRRNAILRRLDDQTQRELAKRLKLFNAKSWQTIIAFEDESPVVGFIVRGRAVGYRREVTGRKNRFLNLAEGDFFGAHKRIDPEQHGLEVRTATPLVALVMSKEDFEELVVPKIGVPALWDQMAKQVFLRRSALCSEWRPASVARFSELAVLSGRCPSGTVIRYGQPVRSLYVLYEGQAKALRGGKRLGTINPGDFFGELSLLQTSAATADVETSEGGSFLTVDRLDFIRFLSRNYHVALQMEKLCSRRLGYPLFPLERRAFEEN